MATLSFKYRAPAQREHAGEPALGRMSDDPVDRDADEGKRDRWWYESSYDLRCGLEVDDSTGQTIPGDVLDRWFKR